MKVKTFKRKTMKKLDNLKTMKEKEQLDPKEMMENRLTR